MTALPGCASDGPVAAEVRTITLLDLAYCSGDGAELTLDLYQREPVTSGSPLVVYFHGGGWLTGSKRGDRWLELLREPLLARGYIVASVDYRLAFGNPWPAQIEDAKCAIRALRSWSAAYGIDADRIGVWGGSAGGHLAALLGTTDATAGFDGDGGHAGVSSRVNAVVDLYGPADLRDFTGWPADYPRVLTAVFGTADPTSPILGDASPARHASAGDASFLIVHGEDDTLVPVSQSQALFEALLQAGVPAELVRVRNAGHGLLPVSGTMSPDQGEIVDLVVTFFERNLGMSGPGETKGGRVAF